MFKFFKRAKKSSETKKSAPEEVLIERYKAFEALLRANNLALETMADLEQKASGEYLFDKAYLRAKVDVLSSSIYELIKNINILTKDKFPELFQRYDDIKAKLEEIIKEDVKIEHTSAVIPLSKLKQKQLNAVGGKVYHLAEMKNALNIPVPEGFAITSYAFKRFVLESGISARIQELLSTVRLDDLEGLNKVSSEIQALINSARLPQDIEAEILQAMNELEITLKETQGDKPLRVAVRSSAIFEDSEFSFAGQYATFLNVTASEVIDRYKQVVASLFTPRAVFYYKTKGFLDAEMVMAVGVLQMIEAKASGVMYSRDPNNANSDEIIINAVWGLGKAVVDGIYEPQYYAFARAQGKLTEQKVSLQSKMLVECKDGDICEVDVPAELRGKPCLNSEDIARLVNFAELLERHYDCPQDIEWVIDKTGKLYILQSRQLKILTPTSTAVVPRLIEGAKVLIDKGVIACKGIGFGKVFVVKEEDEIAKFPEGAVLVARHTSTKFVTIMNKASAIITDIGSTTSHMASISREYEVPTIVNTEIATVLLQSGMVVTVDAINCNIYEGEIKELIELKDKVKDKSFEKTHIYKILDKLLKHIVPLNLVDPEGANFTAKSCMTFHDITRFCHEHAMNAMFDLGLSYGQEALGAVTLKVAIPTEITMIDIGGGISSQSTEVTEEDITSIPLKALLAGMTSMRWPEPPRADAGGFLGMIARTATITEDQLVEAGKKSFVIVSKNYLNFSIRLGYHFSLIEAFVGENINDNYIRFFFKGGGAQIDRRLRRVALITNILKKMGFTVKVTNDVINAQLTDFTEPHLTERLEIMGKLTAYTKQLDMTLYNDLIMEMFTEQFIKEHMKSFV